MHSILQISMRKLSFLSLALGITGLSYAQLSGTYNIPGDYPSLDLAITDLNTQGVGPGGVTLNLIAGNPQTAPAGGYIITATGNLTDQIFIQGNGNLITASAGLTAGALNDAIFKIVGADYVTLTNFSMQENAANTTTTAGSNNMTEWGVALLYASVTDGANNCQILGNTITLNRTYQNTFGIYANATHSASSVTTSATATTPDGGFSGLKVYNNAISNVNNGIVVIGPTGVANMSDGIDIGGSSLATANSISNFGTTGTFSSYVSVSGSVFGILVRNSKNINVSYNTVQSSAGGTTSGTLRGIYIPSFSVTPTGTFSVAVNNNTIAMTSGSATGNVEGITVESTTASATSTLDINNNHFTALGHSAASSGTLKFISQVAPALTVTVSGNNFDNVSSTTTGSVTFLALGYSMPTGGAQTYTNNYITGGYSKTGAGGTVTVFSSNSSSPAGTLHTATGNNFSGITVTGVTGITGWSNTDGGQPTKIITNNTFSNWTGGTSSITVISQNFGGNGSQVNNNTITNITSQAAITAISSGGSNQGAVQQVANNTISGISSTGTGGTVIGITNSANSVTTLSISGNSIGGLSTTGASSSCTGITSAGTNTVNIFQNTVSGLSASGSTPVIAGLATTGSTGTIQIYSNKVYNLSATGSATNQAVNGAILQGGLNVNFYNNVIGDLTSPLANGNNIINGVQIGSTVANSTYRVYYNTLYINASSSGANFGTSGISHTVSATSTIAALDLRNNIIINESIANGTGLTVANRRSGTALNNFATTSNRNLLYAGAPGAANLIFYDGTTSYQTISLYQGAITPREVNSFSGESFTYGTPGSFFISLTGGSPDFLKPVDGITTQTEGGAQQITTPAITADYLSVVRAGNGGYTGTGTNPDLGAYEFEGITPAPVITFNSLTPGATSQCSTSSRLVSVTITTTAGTITDATLNYSFNGVPQAPIVMVNSSGNIWEGTIPASVPVNASVTWNVVTNSSLALTATYIGAGFADEPLFGQNASVVATATTTCSGDGITLQAVLQNPAPAASYTLPPAVVNPLTDEDMGNVTITSGATTILNNSTAAGSLVGTIGTATGTPGSYSNFTAFGPYVLNLGQSYNFSMTSLQPGSPYNNAMAIYIDYNRNGVFTDAGEKVYGSAALTSGAHTETGSFVVPLSAATGVTRMRIISNESSLITSPTQTVNYGEYEEYLIDLRLAATSISWSDGLSTIGTGTSIAVSPTSTTTYTATIAAAGCTFVPSPSATIAVNPLPADPISASSSHCGTQVPTAGMTSVSGASSPVFNWYDAPTAGALLQSSISTTYLAAVSSTTTFYVSEQDVLTGCESSLIPVTVTVISADPIAAVAAVSPVCIGGAVDLTASNTNPIPSQFYSYTWTGPTGSGAETPVSGTNVLITPSVPGTYSYDVTGVDAGCSAVTQVTVTIDPFVAALSAINISCNGLTDGSFTLASSSCGVLPYQYSTDGSSFGSIPTNLGPGLHSVVVMDNSGHQTSPISINVVEPSTVINDPFNLMNATICQDASSAIVDAQSTSTAPMAASLVVSFDLSAQPTETNSSPGNIIASASYALPAGATITGGTLDFPDLTAIGSSWMSDIRLGFSGAVTNAAATGTGSAGTPGTFNYTRVIPAASITASGTVNLLYWDFVSDNAGAEATFPVGPGVATLTINYTVPTPVDVTWWDASTGGNLLGNGGGFESVGTSILPNTATPGTYTLFAQGQDGTCASVNRVPVTVDILPSSYNTIVASDCQSYTLNSQTYTATGMYTQTLSNSIGCDSIITLDLTIYGTTSSTTVISTCNTYTWTDGNTYTASGVYTQTLTGVMGCDSIAELDLTINVPNSSTTTISACGSYMWTDGNTYTVSGAYSQLLTGSTGCDSTANLDLTILTLPVVTATDNLDGTITASSGVSYEWINCATGLAIPLETSQTLTVTANGAYAAVVSNGSCSDTSACVTINYMGFENYATEKILIYPNPTKDDVRISFNGSNAYVTIYDAQGKLLNTISVNTGDSISLQDYDRGVYYFRIRTENDTSTHKVIKD